MKIAPKNWVIITSGIFLVLCLYSAWTEELLPIWQQGNRYLFWRHFLGVLLCVLGALVFCFGGYIYSISFLYGFFNDAQVAKNIQVIRSEIIGSKHKARAQNLKKFFNYSQLGCLWLLLGFSIIALGAFIIHNGNM